MVISWRKVIARYFCSSIYRKWKWGKIVQMDLLGGYWRCSEHSFCNFWRNIHFGREWGLPHGCIALNTTLQNQASQQDLLQQRNNKRDWCLSSRRRKNFGFKQIFRSLGQGWIFNSTEMGYQNVMEICKEITHFYSTKNNGGKHGWRCIHSHLTRGSKHYHDSY